MVLKKVITTLGIAVMLWVIISWIEVITTGIGGELCNGNVFSLIANNF